MSPKPSHADDCERLLRLLSDAPAGGLTMDEIQTVTAQSGEPWSLATINDVLCAIRPQIAVEKVRQRGKKLTRYGIKLGR